MAIYERPYQRRRQGRRVRKRIHPNDRGDTSSPAPTEVERRSRGRRHVDAAHYRRFVGMQFVPMDQDAVGLLAVTAEDFRRQVGVDPSRPVHGCRR
jgi:hypothetical protein